MELAKFIKYENGCYHFLLNESEEFEFEEIAQQALAKFNLKEDEEFKKSILN